MEKLKTLFANAHLAHKSGKPKEATQLYQELLLENNTFYPAQYNLAIIYLEQDNIKEAKKYFQQTLKNNPNHKLSLQSLASLYLKENNHHLAKEYFDKALAQPTPHSAELLFNWGQWLIQTQQPLAAYDALQQATTQDPNLWEAWYNLGTIKHAYSDYNTASKHFQKTISLNNNYFPAHYNLMLCYKALGQTIQALEQAKKTKQLAPDDKAVDFIYQSLNSPHNIYNMPKEYIQLLFNQYASYYEQHLNHLHYNLPQTAQDFLKNTSLPQNTPLALDLGCGTGLGAQALQQYAQKWHGVDLASSMITQAETKNIYSKLYCDDILTFLPKATSKYNFIISLEVLNYLGQLESLCKLITNSLISGGYWLFSCETTEHPKSNLTNELRFAHNLQQLTANLTNNNLKIMKQIPVQLRQHLDKKIKGQLILVQFL